MNDQEKKLANKTWAKVKNASADNRTHNVQIQQIVELFPDLNLFVDCGPGLAGSEAWSVRDMLPECRIIGFEPQAFRFDKLMDSGYPGELLPIAVGESCGVIKGLTGFEGGRSDFWRFGTEDLVDGEFYRKTEVKCVTVDSILDGAEKVFVWADIEGSEMAMLKGCLDGMKSGQIIGFMLELREIRDEHDTDDIVPASKIFEFMEERGYESLSGKRIKGHHEDFIFRRRS